MVRVKGQIEHIAGLVEIAMRIKVAVWGLTGLVVINGFLSAHQAQPNQPKPPRGAPAILWGDLQPGPYSIGFRVIYERDKTRNWLKAEAGSNVAIPDLGRPIRISIWYPATLGQERQPMHYGDYYRYAGPESFRELNDELEKSDRESELKDFMEITPQGHEILERLFATPVAAYSNTPVAHGRFPLVLYSGGLGSRGDANVELGEFLASHGYVVATVPQLGPSDKELDLGSSPGEVALHVRDLEFALNFLRTQPYIDNQKLATIGHSAGGTAALDFAVRHPEVRAVVGLDGSYGFTGGSRMFRRFPDYAPDRIRAAILDLRRANGVQSATLDLSVLQDMRLSDRYLVTFNKMFHGDFTEFGTIGLKLSVPLPPNNDGRTRQTGYEGNQHAYRVVLNFLDTKLRGKPEGIRHMFSEISQSDGARIVHVRAAAVTRGH